ncbi:hypothetical protein RB195_005537 [Necator americanus]|uniref:Uncharacterized protein n=1 Tax=Necator americanus TaxID=51031 RepID=A0ABR1BSB5_NECAM
MSFVIDSTNTTESETLDSSVQTPTIVTTHDSKLRKEKLTEADGDIEMVYIIPAAVAFASFIVFLLLCFIVIQVTKRKRRHKRKRQDKEKKHVRASAVKKPKTRTKTAERAKKLIRQKKFLESFLHDRELKSDRESDPKEAKRKATNITKKKVTAGSAEGKDESEIDKELERQRREAYDNVGLDSEEDESVPKMKSETKRSSSKSSVESSDEKRKDGPKELADSKENIKALPDDDWNRNKDKTDEYVDIVAHAVQTLSID